MLSKFEWHLYEREVGGENPEKEVSLRMKLEGSLPNLFSFDHLVQINKTS